MGAACSSCACCKPESQLGPKRLTDRGCTDVLCLLMFIIVVGSIFGIGIYALINGNIDGIIYPSDYNGAYCGKPGTALENHKYAWFPQLDVDIKAQALVIAAGYWWNFVPYTLCVEECPAKFSLVDSTMYGGCNYTGADCGSGAGPKEYYATFGTTLMLRRCFPLLEVAQGSSRDLCSVPSCTAANKTCVSVEGEPEAGSDTVWEVSSGDDVPCERTITETTSVVFTPEGADDDSYKLTQEFAEYVSHVSQASKAVDEALLEMGLCIFLGTIVMGFAWVLFLWLFAGVIVFVAIVLLVVLLMTITIICYVQAGWAPNLTSLINSTTVTTGTVDPNEYYGDIGNSDYQTAYQFFAGLMTILLVLVVIMLVVWRRCIARAIAIIKESTKVFRTIPALIVWPLVTILGLAAVQVWAVVVALYIFYGDASTYTSIIESVAEATNTSSTIEDYLTDDRTTQWVFFVLHAFGVLWAIEFIKACAWITMSGAVCYWYFFKDDVENKEKFPLLNSCRRVFRYHLGSAAFGALIIAICQLIRYVLATVDYYTKDLQQQNFVYRLVIKCAQCAMWCLQKTIEFISYFGFIYIALEGMDFCKACRTTFGFLLTPKNAAQTAVNKTVEKLIVLIIAWTTPTLLALVCYGVLEENSEYIANGNNPIYPALLVWIGSFFIADAIATVFECTIDTIFLCSFKDASEYGGKFMSADMRSAFGMDGDVAMNEATPIQTSNDYKDHHDAKRKQSVEQSGGGGPVMKA